MENRHQNFLERTAHFDFEQEDVIKLSKLVDGNTDIERAVSIYYLVRDKIKYNPYTFLDGSESLSAGYAAMKKEAFCIPKSALMVALCRKHGIPARIGLADVRNHLSSPKLLEYLKTDYFTMHAYTEVLLGGCWVRSTPVFNKKLCEKFGVIPLEFDGVTDSMLHPMTADGRKHMEYIVDHGVFADVPVKLIMENFQKYYPHLMAELTGFAGSQSLETDISN